MAYIDQTGLEHRFGADEINELIGADPAAIPPETGEQDKLARACEDAANLIDGYLATRYSLPLASVPTIVVAWASDIARHELWDARAPDEIRRRYDEAISQLRDLAAGKLALPPGSDGAQPASGIAFGSYGAARVFTSDTLQGF